MDVKELQQRKKELETRIADLLDLFEEQTGTYVDYIHFQSSKVEHHYIGENNSFPVSNVKTKCVVSLVVNL